MLKIVNALIYNKISLGGKKGNPSFQTIFLMNENLKISSSFPQKAHKNSKEFGSEKMNK